MKQYIKKEGKEKNAASETEKDRNRYPKKSSNFGSCLITLIPLVGNISSKLQTSLLPILMIVKNQFKKGNGENIFFSFLAGRHQSVNLYIWA